jgi:RimJ/RimL family protein N-acetyltransferase
MTLRRAGPADIAAIMAIERVPGFEDCVGRSSHAEHAAMLASPRYTYFVGLGSQDEVCAFAILRDFDDPHGNLYLKRFVVARAGEGMGTAFLRLLLQWAFAHTSAHRFYLDRFAHNLRAHRLYRKFGFTRDGVLRQAYLGADGQRRDLTLMALTRPEWEASVKFLAGAGPV